MRGIPNATYTASLLLMPHGLLDVHSTNKTYTLPIAPRSHRRGRIIAPPQPDAVVVCDAVAQTLLRPFVCPSTAHYCAAVSPPDCNTVEPQTCRDPDAALVPQTALPFISSHSGSVCFSERVAFDGPALSTLSTR